MKKTIISSMAVATMLAVGAAAEHWPTGYYRTVADPDNSYYYNDENRWYCHVQNATQASLYDVESQVRIVGDTYGFLSLATSLNECSWPNGFYNTASNGQIYRLYPGNVCSITSPEMLDAYGGTDSVVQAEDNSDFGAHRTWIGQCFWPSFDADTAQK